MGAGCEMGKKKLFEDGPPRERGSFYRRGRTGIGADISWVACRLGGRANQHASRHKLAAMPGCIPSGPACHPACTGCDAGHQAEPTGTRAGICWAPCRVAQKKNFLIS